MTLSRRAAAAALVLASCSLLACSTMPRVGPPAPSVGDSQAEAAYRRTLDRWTRQAQIYQQLDSRMFIAATLEAAEFRASRVARQATFRALPEADAAALLAAERDLAKSYLELTVGLFANERRFDDLGSPGSFWRVALITPSGEAVPSRVERVTRPDPNLRGLYPFVDEGWTVYRFSFERAPKDGPALLPPETAKVTLKVASALGRAELSWELGAPGADPAAWP